MLSRTVLWQRQALLVALGGALTLREQLLVPSGFCRARSRHHKGKTLHFASVKGTSSRISNIAVLEAFHTDRVLLLTFFPVLNSFFLVLSCWREERYKRGTTSWGEHIVKPPRNSA